MSSLTYCIRTFFILSLVIATATKVVASQDTEAQLSPLAKDCSENKADIDLSKTDLKTGALQLRALELLSKNNGLTSLNFSKTPFEADAFQELMVLVKESKSLKTLILRKCELTVDAATILRKTLEHNLTLEELNLDKNPKIGSLGAEILCDGINDLHLKKITLREIGLEGRLTKPLIAAFMLTTKIELLTRSACQHSTLAFQMYSQPATHPYKKS